MVVAAMVDGKVVALAMVSAAMVSSMVSVTDDGFRQG